MFSQMIQMQAKASEIITSNHMGNDAAMMLLGFTGLALLTVVAIKAYDVIQDRRSDRRHEELRKSNG